MIDEISLQQSQRNLSFQNSNRQMINSMEQPISIRKCFVYPSPHPYRSNDASLNEINILEECQKQTKRNSLNNTTQHSIPSQFKIIQNIIEGSYMSNSKSRLRINQLLIAWKSLITIVHAILIFLYPLNNAFLLRLSELNYLLITLTILDAVLAILQVQAKQNYLNKILKQKKRKNLSLKEIKLLAIIFCQTLLIVYPYIHQKNWCIYIILFFLILDQLKKIQNQQLVTMCSGCYHLLVPLISFLIMTHNFACFLSYMLEIDILQFDQQIDDQYSFAFFESLQIMTFNINLVPTNGNSAILMSILYLMATVHNIYYVHIFIYPSFNRDILKFCQSRNLGSSLTSKILNQFQTDFEHNLVKQFPESIISQIYEEERINILKQMFPKLESHSLINLASIAMQHNYYKGDIIYKEGEIDDSSIYFILKGKLKIQTSLNRNLAKLNSHQVFGEYSFYTSNGRQETVIARQTCKILSIKRNDFLQVITDNEFEEFNYIKDNILQERNMPLKCWLCSKIDHLYKQCPLISLEIDKLKLIKQYQLDNNQKRVKLFRYPFKKKRIIEVKTQKQSVNQRISEFEMFTPRSTIEFKHESDQIIGSSLQQIRNQLSKHLPQIKISQKSIDMQQEIIEVSEHDSSSSQISLSYPTDKSPKSQQQYQQQNQNPQTESEYSEIAFSQGRATMSKYQNSKSKNYTNFISLTDSSQYSSNNADQQQLLYIDNYFERIKEFQFYKPEYNFSNIIDQWNQQHQRKTN